VRPGKRIQCEKRRKPNPSCSYSCSCS
jgi:hypothetical protein